MSRHKEDPSAVRDAKRQAWLMRTAEALGMPPDAALALLRQKRVQSLRLNPLRGDVHKAAEYLQKIGWLGEPYPWAQDTYALKVPVAEIRDSEFVASGQVFIQNAASWLPVLALQPQPGERILDVCAAPGGKASHIAALTDNQAELWINDNSRTRLVKMRANLDRLGVTAARTILYDATQLARRLAGEQFDKILLDAPCSGEGLMHYDRDKDFETWSVAHIKRLSKLQKRILTQAWQLLKPGGTLVYSTCTMAPEENEVVVDYLLRHHPEAQIEPLNIGLPNTTQAVLEWSGKVLQPAIRGCLRLHPSSTIEAFFVCALRKNDDKSTATVASARQNRYDSGYYDDV